MAGTARLGLPGLLLLALILGKTFLLGITQITKLPGLHLVGTESAGEVAGEESQLGKLSGRPALVASSGENKVLLKSSI